MYLLLEIFSSLSSSLRQWMTEKPGSARIVFISGAVFAFLLVGKIAVAILFPSDQPTFSYRKVYGSIKYSDGTEIPIGLTLTFIPQETDPDARSHPPSGMAVTETETGEFTEATSREPGDGIIRGSHTVYIGFAEPVEHPDDLVPEKYLRSDTSPLRADTSELPFVFQIERPPQDTGDARL